MNDVAPSTSIKRRERTAIIQSLRAGVVPRIGLHHIQVGRKAEIEALLRDFAIVKDGGAAIRFVIGRFGTGKTFLLNLASVVAQEQGLLVARADITTERRLHGSGGQARGLYAELMRNLSSRAKPDGGALVSIVETFLSGEADAVGGDLDALAERIETRLAPLRDLVAGFDFAKVLHRYYEGFARDDEALQNAAVRWLRGEYSTKTEARKDLGVRTIVDDAGFYDALKLMASFARIAGHSGLLVAIDELVVLSHRLASSRARMANYESILRILNDCLQGSVEGLMVMFGGTDECIEDRRRGLYSYEALATRLAPNEFARRASDDLTGPVMHLTPLTAEDLYVLLYRVRHVFAAGDPARHLVPEEGLRAFLEFSARRLGAEYFRTPRDVVTRFVGLLSVLESDKDRSWREALDPAVGADVAPSDSAEASESSPEDVENDDDLVSFRL